jgi:SPP1 family predicted phage head-tail adaptor
MPLAAGSLRETVTVQVPSETRNDMGESEQTWSTFAVRRAAVQAMSFVEQERRGQIGGATSYMVRIRYLEGITSAMRLRWDSRDGRILYVSSVVEKGHREEHELTCEEQA